jgi:hypothetical protein
MFRRVLLPLTMALAVLAFAVTPAFAGEDPDPTPTPTPPAAQPTPTQPTPSQPAPVLTGSAHLRTSQGCMDGNRTKASVSGSRIESVRFFVDGKAVETLTSPNDNGRYTFSMSCSRLGLGSHRARASVSFQRGVQPRHSTLLFRVTRARQVMPQFAG